MPIRERIGTVTSLQRLDTSLKGAHMPITAPVFFQYAVILTLLSALGYLLVQFLLMIFGIGFNLIPFLPSIVTQILLFCVLVPAVFFGTLYYPALVAQGRKTRIETDLPYAVTYMEALSTTVTLYALFKNVYEAEPLYGEVSRECGMIVRDVELFGEDLLTAMRRLQEITPSKNFADLLNDLALVYRTGGNLKDFFDSRSDSYRELAKQELEATLQIMEMLAEIYVTVFVAGPIAISIMLVAQNLSGRSGQMAGIMPLMYIGLPLGAVVFIFILYVLLPADNMEITHGETKDTEFTDEIVEKTPEKEYDPAFIKQIEARKQRLRYEDILRHPFRYFIADYSIGLLLGMILAVLVMATYFTGMFARTFPTDTAEVLICITVIVSIVPLMVAYESRRYYVSQVEAQMPEFLRDIADMKDVGITLQGAIAIVSTSKLGVLASELKIVSEELKWGASTSSALIRMEERIGLVAVKRAISLIVKASEITDQLREILTIAISDLDHYLKMKNKRFNVSFVYLAVIYLSFGIYLYCSYQLNDAFIASFAKMNVKFDIAGNVRDMFRVAIIIGGFSGLMVGQLTSNNLLSGLKHTIVFLVAAIIVYVYIL